MNESFTEIAGTWPEVQILLAELTKTKSDKAIVAAAIKKATTVCKYSDDSLLTVDQLFDIVDLIYEMATDRKNYGDAAIVNTTLSKGFRKALKTGDLANNKDLSCRDSIAGMILDNVYDQVPSGLTTIIFDIVCNEWFKSKPKGIDQLVGMTADQILEARGLPKKLSGTGRRGGYRKEQRDEVERHLRLLHSIMINVDRVKTWTTVGGERVQVPMSYQTPAIILELIAKQTPMIRDAEEKKGTFHGFLLRPGRIFAEYYISEDQQYARLSQRAWQYDHLRQAWEISLAYYFSRIWRIRAYRRDQLHQGITVRKVLEEIDQPVDTRKPSKTRKRLERALDQLCADGIISDWKYDSVKHVKGYGWADKWQQCKVSVTAPKELIDQYPKITGRDKPTQEGKKGKKKGDKPSQNKDKGDE